MLCGGGDCGGEVKECITVGELRQLMTLRGDDCVRAIQRQYGDTDGLCRRLNTDPQHGLFIY